jgi:hypothetical protein
MREVSTRAPRWTTARDGVPGHDAQVHALQVPRQHLAGGPQWPHRGQRLVRARLRLLAEPGPSALLCRPSRLASKRRADPGRVGPVVGFRVRQGLRKGPASRPFLVPTGHPIVPLAAATYPKTCPSVKKHPSSWLGQPPPRPWSTPVGGASRTEGQTGASRTFVSSRRRRSPIGVANAAWLRRKTPSWRVANEPPTRRDMGKLRLSNPRFARMSDRR